eukprot:GHVP01049561.1.p1 GENE.GHVP01049561.1~~GHVP01049561.1.p1  ORF type:complete len:182 (+),score=26.77 GHVP01049561.1:234-779(+)
MRILVTVGTTSFNSLIEQTMEKSFLEQLNKCGYTELIVQYGNHQLDTCKITEIANGYKIVASFYSYMDGMGELFETLETLITHGGAGTITLALDTRKHVGFPKNILAVPNDGLLDLHQREFVEDLNSKGIINMCELNELEGVFKENRFLTKPNNLPEPDPFLLSLFIENLFDDYSLGFDCC